jgi:hypothetical protein
MDGEFFSQLVDKANTEDIEEFIYEQMQRLEEYQDFSRALMGYEDDRPQVIPFIDDRYREADEVFSEKVRQLFFPSIDKA